MCDDCQAHSGLELVAQSLEERAAVPRAARIVLPVRADEEEWVLDLGAGPKLDATQVLVRLELGAGHSRLAGPRGGGEGEKLRMPPAVRSPDEQQPPVRYRRNLLAKMLFTWSERPLPGSASRVQSPRYSTRNQLSIRLAVAASGSSFSREMSAQKALGSVNRLPG